VEREMEWVVIWLGLAIAAGVIASSKGRSGFGYFVLGFFLPLIGVLIAIGMSSAKPIVTKQAETTEGRARCPSCAEYIQPAAKKCRFCGVALVKRGVFGRLEIAPPTEAGQAPKL
jgi:hypothetical protein